MQKDEYKDDGIKHLKLKVYFFLFYKIENLVCMCVKLEGWFRPNNQIIRIK